MVTLGQNSVQSVFFAIKQIMLGAHSIVLHILSQRINIFQVSYQRPLFTLLHPAPVDIGSLPPYPGPDPEPPNFHYLIVP